MDVLKNKLSIIGNNLEIAIFGDLTALDVEDEESLFVETLEGKKRIFIDEEGTAYIVFSKVRYNIKDYRQTTLQDFLGGLKWEH